ncbi:MAG: hypothetical protein ACXVB9_01065 [Bdellovibrionota bacterium]
MKASIALLALTLTLPSLAHAASFSCEGREGVRGTIEVKIFKNGKASVKGSYNWDSQSGEDTKTHNLNCTAKENNAGRSGNKTHDYYDLSKGCDSDYLRTEQGLADKDSGWVSLVIAGASDHDSSGYSYANFFCK